MIGAATEGFEPTHVIPPGGLPSWVAPDPARPAARLDPLLPVRLAETVGDWARVVCANGWATWLDGRLLVTLPRGPDPAELLAGEDPRPLLARLERALADYRVLLDDLAAGRLTLGAFAERAAGLRIGAVVAGTEAWLLDLAEHRWYYCDGTRLRGYATDPQAER
ncbi:hypothetical protein OG455_05110 [Kitasatospora sp. NBC_01287]|uniref:hypothetical protein n=1 Tax=Kitasatospora sp. NBC_01287 TaxID=2903573 RepID=UPI0022540A19|nr:hypothetical protein [Kitasatospora sp. NBC_01287]MCX4744906.1 hypothetical protein [Kitasatospora sp. NBC_01287]